jgi:hypothetical protein
LQQLLLLWRRQLWLHWHNSSSGSSAGVCTRLTVTRLAQLRLQL